MISVVIDKSLIRERKLGNQDLYILAMYNGVSSTLIHDQNQLVVVKCKCGQTRLLVAINSTNSSETSTDSIDPETNTI